MPLSEPAPRKLSHSRVLEIKGYERDDGLWDIEGHLTDIKPFPIGDRSGAEAKRAPGEPIHDMWLRLTIDDGFEIRAAEAHMDHSPYSICPEVAPNFDRLAGLKIGPGWNRLVRERLGGVHGCTHLVEMLAQIATAAFQTLWPVRAQRYQKGSEAVPPPGLINSCHSYRADGPVVQAKFPSRHRPRPEATA